MGCAGLGKQCALPALVQRCGKAQCYCYYCWCKNKGGSLGTEGLQLPPTPRPGRQSHAVCQHCLSCLVSGKQYNGEG